MLRPAFQSLFFQNKLRRSWSMPQHFLYLRRRPKLSNGTAFMMIVAVKVFCFENFKSCHQTTYQQSMKVKTFVEMAKIIFKINGKQYEADGRFGPDVSLNEYIRTVADLRGTKAMCHEGGCGACIVTARIPTPPTNELKTMAINSCLVSTLSCHGWEIITVEGIGNRTIGYHEIQSRLAKFNGTQCGYCTPGWIMNMHSLVSSSGKNLRAVDIENSFAGNICRCTGYRPIADAFKSFATDFDQKTVKKLIDIEDLHTFKTCGVLCKNDCIHKGQKSCIASHVEATLDENKEGDWCVLQYCNNESITITGTSFKWFKVYYLADVFKAMRNCNNYMLIAGNTGQGVYHVNEYPPSIIDINSVIELKEYKLDVNLVIGAGVSLTEMMIIFLRMSKNEEFFYLRQFYDHMDLVAHIPVRNIGTIGGNLYLKHVNNSFQSDLFLLFETVGAMITIASEVKRVKVVSLLDFLNTGMENKVIINIMLPPLSKNCSLKTYKIMPRSQNAHAAVNAGFLFKFQHNTDVIEKATIVYGSISPTFIHASQAEKILVGKNLFTEETLQVVLKHLNEEIVPEDAPPEPSVEYRKMLAVALFYKAILSLCPETKLNPNYRSGGEVIKRHTSRGIQIYDTDKTVWPLNKPVPKLEALVQCSGEATFANDLATELEEVFGAFVTADVSPGSILSGFDATKALQMSGVLAFYSAKDIPGENNFTPTNISILKHKEEILCSKEVKFYGQAVGIIVANRENIANKAAKLVNIQYETVSNNKPLLTIKNVLSSSEKNNRITQESVVEPTEIGKDVKSVIYGELSLDSQYHYHLETQTCVVKPTENGIEVYSSSQWLNLTNVAVAQCLNIPVNSVNVIVRRVGGAYGGKITRATQIACAAAIVSHLQGKTCRFILSIEDNMKIIGKRASTFCKFEVGVNTDGEIQYLKNKYYQDNGCSKNETITDMTLHHFPSCYDSRRWHIEANSVLTDLPSTTWCRAPASTEAIATIEYIMEKVAHVLDKDPLAVRLANMNFKDNPIPELINQLKEDSNYNERLAEVNKYNTENRWRKRAIKLLPMTYELFYIGPYNSIVSIYYADGSVAITHGAVEMGQGINTKAAQVCAYILGIPLEKVSVNPSSSFTSPNCMATGASIGSECVAYATMKACQILLERLEPIKNKMKNPTWENLVNEAFDAGVNLQASYMYSTNEPVKPYDIYGVVVLEVELDILTGNHDIRRVDLLEDTGRSLSPEIDVAQIEGSFVMGLGYWTSEQLLYDQKTGKILTDRTWNYKPPGIKDIPADFRVYFRRNSKNEFGVLQSKATGEPAFCLAVVLTHAFREAIRSARLEAGYEDKWINIDNPCTIENIFAAVGHKLEHFKIK